MGQNRDLVLRQCTPDKEPGFSTAEYASRLQALRARMARDGIDLSRLTATGSL
jgi:hypothetical protein